MATYTQEEKQKITTDDDSPPEKPLVLAKITVIARLWAIVTLAVMWAAGITTMQAYYGKSDYQYSGWYLCAASTVVTFFELAWVINKSVCCSGNGCCCRCWALVMWLDNWKKGVLYLLLSIPFFLEGLQLVLGVVSGFMLIVCGCLYIVRSFKDTMINTVKEVRYVKIPNPNIVTHEIATQTDSRDGEYYQQLSQSDYIRLMNR